MSTPGIGDPYWFEWYVGLKYVIQMLNPDSGIDGVIFQHPNRDTIDDVVVEYMGGTKEICFQVKHEIMTSASGNLTFNKLLEKDAKRPNHKCLIDAMFSGWKNACDANGCSIKPILFTNRKLGPKQTARILNDAEYTAYPIGTFFSKLKEEFKEDFANANLSFSDVNLTHQCSEIYTALGCPDISDFVKFIKALDINAGEFGLVELEQELISALATKFSCNNSLAEELFSKLVYALRIWTTSRREDIKVSLEDVYSALGTEEDINESQHRLAPPHPFFESRQSFCKELEQKIRTTDKKVVFISGDPGSGKTSIISYLQSTTNLFLLRYHTFRPISPEQHFYNIDAGMYSSENLWGTLLIQLRQQLKGKISQYEIPVNNKLLTVEMMRYHVCRLLGILAKIAPEDNKRIYVCIDGIDHAARANSDISFLSSLPTPEEIPDGVCFVIVGQSLAIYRTQYPIWLSNDNVLRVEMPKLNASDIVQLICSKIPKLKADAEGLANFVYQCTDGNNLSTVFAIEEIKMANSIDEAMNILRQSGIASDIQQYYNHIWNHMKNVIAHMNLPYIFPESIVACPILLMNGRVNVRVLTQALPYNISESDWKLILNKLHPLVTPCEVDGEYAVFHNDFRVFLMDVISEYKDRYEEIALKLAEYLLENAEGLITYVLGIPLLQCANKTNLIPKYFTPSFIINALAEGVSKQRLDDYAHLSYNAACTARDMEGYINCYLSIKTLYQHTRYYEYYNREYEFTDYPEIVSIDIDEIRTLPITAENLDEYMKVLELCNKLYKAGTNQYVSRALALYDRWFGSVSPYSFLPLCGERVTEEEDWHLRSDEVGFLLQHWGILAAEIDVSLPTLEEPCSNLQNRALSIFGDTYFETCISLRKTTHAIEAINQGYVTKTDFSEKIEDIFYNGTSNEFLEFLPQVDVNPEKITEKLLATAMCITCNKDLDVDVEVIRNTNQIVHVYDENSFAIVLQAFILGFCEQTLEDTVILEHVNSCYASVEGNETELAQIQMLSKFACLLGKYYWESDGITSEEFRIYINNFLTTNLKRKFDYSKARRFLLFVLLRSPASTFLSTSSDFINELRTYLFEIDSLGMYYKTYILDYLKKHKRLDIIKLYINALYGDNCQEINLVENKKEMHKTFSPYGELVEADLMNQFSSQIKWDVVGYMGSDEYALEAPFEYFEYISTVEPSVWREAGLRLYKQSLLAEISNNKYSYDIKNAIAKSAINSGISDFWDLHFWNNEFNMNSDIIYNVMFEIIKSADSLSDIKAVWLLNCGINSWYSQDERMNSKSIFNACRNRAQEIGECFESIVEVVTPEWMNIIKFDSKRSNCNWENTGKYDNDSRVEAIKAEYESLEIHEFVERLRDIPIQSHAYEHYEFIVERLKSENSFTPDIAKKILDNICVYLNGKGWKYEVLDSIVSSVLNLLGEESFWAFAKTIENHLSDYNYQTSNYNMQLLLKLYNETKSDGMVSLFEAELQTQRLWVTGNNHINVQLELEAPQKRMDTPKCLSEMILFILLEQIESQNARKIEVAVFALRLLGEQYSDVIDSIAINYKKLSIIQKQYLNIVITRWVYNGVDLRALRDVLLEEYATSNLLSEKYSIHSILRLLNVEGITDEQISYDAESISFSLPNKGELSTNSSYESFLSFIEGECGSCTQIDNIRRYIAQYSATDTYGDDEHGVIGDTQVPICNQDIDKILYAEEKDGRFNKIPLLSKKSLLLPFDDAFMMTEMPRMICDEEWFPIISDSQQYYGDSDHKPTTEQFDEIARKNLIDGEIVLAACIWYPWSHKNGIIFLETSKILSLSGLYEDDSFGWCRGNFSWLIKDGDLPETENSLFFGGYNLFNRVGGKGCFYLGNSQLLPSSAWRNIFKCKPSDSSPYVWVNENNEKILWLERIASPCRDMHHEAYIRQIMLFRWVCNSNWLNSMLKELRLNLYYLEDCEEMPQ